MSILAPEVGSNEYDLSVVIFDVDLHREVVGNSPWICINRFEISLGFGTIFSNLVPKFVGYIFQN